MFEKEAIRHAFEDTIGVKCLLKPVEDFTYEELSDEQQEKAYDFKKGAEFDYNKANEWHEIESKVTPKREISKQYMPKNKEKVLLKFHFSGDDEIHISDGYYDAYDFEFHIANNPKYRIVCVIAWKEIVLPELPKESE